MYYTSGVGLFIRFFPNDAQRGSTSSFVQLVRSEDLLCVGFEQWVC